MVRSRYFTEKSSKKDNTTTAALLILGAFLFLACIIVGIFALSDLTEKSELTGDIRAALRGYEYSGVYDPHYADTSCNYGKIYEIKTDWYRDRISGKKYEGAILWVHIRGNDPGLIKCASCY